MEDVLKQFEALPVQQRRLCVESFTKFTSMPNAERNRFLRNAELWQAMTPVERKTWRDLVTKLPPMPPGLHESTAPMPPMPTAKAPSEEILDGAGRK
jgi:hypothetical protein